MGLTEFLTRITRIFTNFYLFFVVICEFTEKSRELRGFIWIF